MRACWRRGLPALGFKLPKDESVNRVANAAGRGAVGKRRRGRLCARLESPVVTRLVELRGLRIRGVNLGVLGPAGALVNPLTDLLDLLAGQTRFNRRHDDLLLQTGNIPI